MQYILDIIFLAVFALVVFLSAKKGFFLTLLELAAYVVSFIGAKLLSAALAPSIFNNLIREPVRLSLEKNLGEIGSKDYVGQAAAAIDSIPSSLDGVLKMIGIDRIQLADSISGSKYAGKDLVQNIMDGVVGPVISAVLQTLLFIGIAIILMFVLRLIIRSLNKIIKKLPVLKQMNSSLGALLGVVKGILIVILLALLVGALSGFSGSEKFVEIVGNSFVVRGTQSLLDSISGYTG